MNPTQTPQKQDVVSNENMLEKAFENNDFSAAPPLEDEDLVSHTDDHKAEIKNSWAEFYAMRTEVTEGSATKVEIQQMVVEQQFKPHVVETYEPKVDSKPVFLVQNQKGSGSSWSESGLKMMPDVKDVGKSLLGALNIFREIFMDTFKVVKENVTVKPSKTPEEAKADAEKKAENKRKAGNINAFFAAMQAQISAATAPDAIRAESVEKENINKTVKFTESYKGIKDSFGRVTVYAASMFEREQVEQEKVYKKMEKQQKMAATNGPDLNLDKAAEGGFLSSTGGQGAG